MCVADDYQNSWTWMKELPETYVWNASALPSRRGLYWKDKTWAHYTTKKERESCQQKHKFTYTKQIKESIFFRQRLSSGTFSGSSTSIMLPNGTAFIAEYCFCLLTNMWENPSRRYHVYYKMDWFFRVIHIGFLPSETIYCRILFLPLKQMCVRIPSNKGEMFTARWIDSSGSSTLIFCQMEQHLLQNIVFVH